MLVENTIMHSQVLSDAFLWGLTLTFSRILPWEFNHGSHGNIVFLKFACYE